MLRKVREVYVGKGEKFEYRNLRNAGADKKEIASMVKGPSGNLRAPALKKGAVLVVGFNEEMYRKALL